MSIAGLIAALILSSIVIILIAYPLILRRTEETADSRSQKQRERLAQYYERVLRNIRDLDEDYALGKLDEDDYRRDRAVWLERGAEALKALDQIAPSVSTAPVVETNLEQDSTDEAVEAAIRAYREKKKDAAIEKE